MSRRSEQRKPTRKRQEIADRARFAVANAAGLAELGPLDAAFAFECLHDMSRPVEVLAAIHDAVRSDGLVVIMDEAVADDFFTPGDPVEQVMYGYSTLICQPDGLSSAPSEGTGTVLRRSILTDYAIRAGFASVEVLPIEDSPSSGSTGCAIEVLLTNRGWLIAADY
jgi:hypothetical protein